MCIRGVGKTFVSPNGEIVALDGVDLSVKEQEFVSLLGPSGCGKSTLLMITAGLVRPTAGNVSVGGQVVTGPVTDVSVVFQRDLLFDWRTVMGNVMLQADIRGLNREAARATAMALLTKVGLNGFEKYYPWQLSGGMRQRVAICRALLHDSSLLLLDEPFGALDALTREQMNMDLERIWWSDRRTAIFVTHSIAEAIFLSDRVLVMSPRPGHIVSEVSIGFSRPRTPEIRDTPEFLEYQRDIRKCMQTMGVFR